MKTKPYGLLLRVFVTLALLFLWAPILIVVIISFDTSKFLRFPLQGLTLSNYVAALNNEDFVTGFINSLIIGIATAFVATALALIIVQGTRKSSKGLGVLIQGFATSPLLVPHIVLGLAFLMFYSNLALSDTYLGILIAHTIITLPYGMQSIGASLKAYNENSETVAKTLGASDTVVFWRILLPQIFPGILSALILGFLVSFDESVIVLFLSGQNTTTLPVQILNYLEVRADPVIAAVSVLLIIFSGLLMLFINKVLKVKFA